MSLGRILALMSPKLCKLFALLMFASLLSNPSFLSSLVDPKVRVLFYPKESTQILLVLTHLVYSLNLHQLNTRTYLNTYLNKLNYLFKYLYSFFLSSMY